MNSNNALAMDFDGHNITVLNIDGDPWWIAKEVCGVLELSNPTVSLKSLDKDEVAKFNLGGQSGEVNIVNEPGLYSLILKSRKPTAKKFKRWITHDVIPTIRKTGSYSTNGNGALQMVADFLQKHGDELLQKLSFNTLVAVRDEFNPKITHLKRAYDNHEIRISNLERNKKKITKKLRSEIETIFRSLLHSECPICHKITNWSDVEIDHFHSPDKATLQNTWPVCREHNQAFNNGTDTRVKYQPNFEVYQQRVDEYVAKKQHGQKQKLLFL